MFASLWHLANVDSVPETVKHLFPVPETERHLSWLQFSKPVRGATATPMNPIASNPPVPKAITQAILQAFEFPGPGKRISPARLSPVENFPTVAAATTLASSLASHESAVDITAALLPYVGVTFPPHSTFLVELPFTRGELLRLRLTSIAVVVPAIAAPIDGSTLNQPRTTASKLKRSSLKNGTGRLDLARFHVAAITVDTRIVVRVTVSHRPILHAGLVAAAGIRDLPGAPLKVHWIGLASVVLPIAPSVFVAGLHLVGVASALQIATGAKATVHRLDPGLVNFEGVGIIVAAVAVTPGVLATILRQFVTTDPRNTFIFSASQQISAVSIHETALAPQNGLIQARSSLQIARIGSAGVSVLTCSGYLANASPRHALVILTTGFSVIAGTTITGSRVWGGGRLATMVDTGGDHRGT